MAFMVSSLMLMSNHAMMSLILLLTTTLWLGYVINNIFKSMLMSLLLILVMIGGLLVMFVYMASLLPSQQLKMKFSLNWLIWLMLFPFLSNQSMHFSKMCKVNLSIMYNFPTMMFVMLTILFLTLILIISITQVQEGPLRTN